MSKAPNGRAAISPAMALRIDRWLGREYGMAAGVWLAQQPAYDLWHQQHSQQAAFGDSLSRYPHAAPNEVGAKLPRSLAACFPLINLLDEQKNSSTAARCLSNTRPTSKPRSAHAGPHCKSQKSNLKLMRRVTRPYSTCNATDQKKTSLQSQTSPMLSKTLACPEAEGVADKYSPLIQPGGTPSTRLSVPVPL